MAKPPINAVKFRLGRVAEDWAAITTLLRAAAGEPSYAGPDIQAVERVGGAIAEIKSTVGDWAALDQVQRRRRSRKPRSHQRETVLQAVSQAAAERR